MKFTITVTDFRAHHKNTLRGYATIRIDELKLSVCDLAIHEHSNGSRWVGLPAKPVLDSAGVAKRKPDGKIEYTKPLLSFDNGAVRDAFSAAVIAALIECDDHAFDHEGA